MRASGLIDLDGQGVCRRSILLDSHLVAGVVMPGLTVASSFPVSLVEVFV